MSKHSKLTNVQEYSDAQLLKRQLIEVNKKVSSMREDIEILREENQLLSAQSKAKSGSSEVYEAMKRMHTRATNDTRV